MTDWLQRERYSSAAATLAAGRDAGPDVVAAFRAAYADREGDPIRSMWELATSPREMFEVLSWIHGDVDVTSAAFASALGTLERRLAGPEPELEIARQAAARHGVTFTEELVVHMAEALGTARKSFELAEPVSAFQELAFWSSKLLLPEIAQVIRELLPWPTSLDMLVSHARRSTEERKERQREARARRERGYEPSFPEIFEQELGRPPPFPIPLDAKPLTSDGVTLWNVVTLSPAPDGTRALLLPSASGQLETFAVGTFMAGFWGHGVNSDGFYYCAVGARIRVYCRFSLGGIYSDPKRCARRIFEWFEAYHAFRRDHEAHVKRVSAVHLPGWAQWSVECASGEVLSGEPDFIDWEEIARELRARGA